jgi:hypothetical protein
VWYQVCIQSEGGRESCRCDRAAEMLPTVKVKSSFIRRFQESQLVVQFYSECLPPCPPCGADSPGAPASPACSICRNHHALAQAYPRCPASGSGDDRILFVFFELFWSRLTELAPSLIKPSSRSRSMISCSWPTASAYGMPSRRTLVETTQRLFPVKFKAEPVKEAMEEVVEEILPRVEGGMMSTSAAIRSSRDSDDLRS